MRQWGIRLILVLVTTGGLAFSLIPQQKQISLSTHRSQTKPLFPLSSAPDTNTPFIRFGSQLSLDSDHSLGGKIAGTPLSLATGDLNKDGLADLVTSYQQNGNGRVQVRLGNANLLHPRNVATPTLTATKASEAAPFSATEEEVWLPATPDFVAVGDFDADGHPDIAVAAKGGKEIYLFSGTGQGVLTDVKTITVSGTITAFSAGEVNRRDGLTDLVLGVQDEMGFGVLVFEGPTGALNCTPEHFRMTALVNAIACGEVDSDWLTDLVVASGDRILLIHGRDRRLSQDASRQAEVARPQIEERVLSSTIKAIALGNFTVKDKTDIAVLIAEGEVQILSPISNTTATMAAYNSEAVVQLPSSFRESITRRQPELMTARASSLDVDHLLIADVSNQQIHIVTNPQAVSVEQAAIRFAENLGGLVSLDIAAAPMAVLPMRLNEDAISDLVVLCADRIAPSLILSEAQNTIVVTQTQTSGVMAGSLEQAIRDANASPGLDRIVFDLLDPDGYCAAASAITDAVVIDGTTQRGYSGTPFVQIKATTSQHLSGLAIYGGNSVVRGLVLIESGTFGQLPTAGSGVLLKDGGNNIVEHCYIGVDRRGTCKMIALQRGVACESGNSRGVTIEQSADNKIGGTTPQARNIISGNAIFAVQIGANSTGNQIAGNYIGPDVTGTQRIASVGGVRIAGDRNIVGGTTPGSGNLVSCAAGQGIAIFGGNGNLLQGNYVGVNPAGLAPNSKNGFANRNEIAVSEAIGTTLGGTVATARNVIAADGQSGVIFFDTTSESLVQGNHIGVDPSGTIAIGLLSDLSLSGRSSQVGGNVAGARNVIFGGINIGWQGTDNRIQGNYIGTTATGMSQPLYTPSIFSNYLWAGVSLRGKNNLVGGVTAAERNVISGNTGEGINIAGDDNRVWGNYIGVAADGETALGNSGPGVQINYQGNGLGRSAIRNVIGGIAQGQANIIAQNNGAGVVNDIAGNDFIVRGNSIYSNLGIGIDIGGRGPSPINPYTLGSNWHNAPVVTLATTEQGGLTVKGYLNSVPNATTTIDFYLSPICHFSGYGQGKTYLGSTEVRTGEAPDTEFFFRTTQAIAPGQILSATATRQGGWTSEFSTCVVVNAGCVGSYNFTGAFDFEKTLAAQNQFIKHEGGTGKIGVGTINGCVWTATANAEWITLTDIDQKGGIIRYSVGPNPTLKPRTGTVSIGTVKATVTQAGKVTLVSGASYQSAIKWGAIVSGFGDAMSSLAQQAGALPLPTSLDGTTIHITGDSKTSRPLPLFYVSPLQVNFYLPTLPYFSDNLTVYVVNKEGGISVGQLKIANGFAPTLFSANANGAGIAAAVIQRVKADGSSTYESLATYDPIQRKNVPQPIDLSVESESVYLLLFGNCVPPYNAGEVKFGDVNVKVSYAGPQGDFVGLDQINVLLPRILVGRGLVDVQFKYDDYLSNTVQIKIK